MEFLIDRKPAGKGSAVGFESLTKCFLMSIIDFLMVTLSRTAEFAGAGQKPVAVRCAGASGSVPVVRVKSPNGVAKVCVAVKVRQFGKRSPTATWSNEDVAVGAGERDRRRAVICRSDGIAVALVLVIPVIEASKQVIRPALRVGRVDRQCGRDRARAKSQDGGARRCRIRRARRRRRHERGAWIERGGARGDRPAIGAALPVWRWAIVGWVRKPARGRATIPSSRCPYGNRSRAARRARGFARESRRGVGASDRRRVTISTGSGFPRPGRERGDRSNADRFRAGNGRAIARCRLTCATERSSELAAAARESWRGA